MEADGERSAASAAEETVQHVDARELACEAQDERLDSLVGDEEIRAKPHDGDRETLLARPLERLDELVERLRASERRRGATDPEGREAPQRHVMLDLH
jgi:hypothetical protein